MKQTDSHSQPTTGSSVAKTARTTKPGAPPPAAPPQPEPEFGYSAPEHYDPAEYRGVPVKRKPRYDGWTEEKQRRFIEVLADTGLVSHAAKEVGMTRLSAYRLRRAPYAAAFARAWDVARERAGALIEDIAFERAIEGVEQEVYNGAGELTGSKTVYNDRLLTYLLSHLKPERYGRDARGASGAWRSGRAPAPGEPEPLALSDASSQAAHEPATPRELPPPHPGGSDATLDDALRAMEPVLPAPAEELLDAEQLENDLLCAEITDGKLSEIHCEQRPPKSPERLRADEFAAQDERGRLAAEKLDRKEKLSDAEFDDFCVHLDPTQAGIKRRRPRD